MVRICPSVKRSVWAQNPTYESHCASYTFTDILIKAIRKDDAQVTFISWLQSVKLCSFITTMTKYTLTDCRFICLICPQANAGTCQSAVDSQIIRCRPLKSSGNSHTFFLYGFSFAYHGSQPIASSRPLVASVLSLFSHCATKNMHISMECFL